MTPPNPAAHTKDLGHFRPDGRAFVINSLRLPRHWYNYLWNDDYVSLVSQVAQGESLAQDDMGRRIEAVGGRMLHLRDTETGHAWTANGLPLSACTSARCTHGLGYTEIALQAHGITSRWRLFVPREGACEIWTLRVRNEGDQVRRLRVFPYLNVNLGGPLKPQAYYMQRGEFCAETQSALQWEYGRFGDATQRFVFLTTGAAIGGYDTRHQGYVGFGTDQHPDAVEAGACTCTGCIMEKGILALQTDLVVEPGATARVDFLIGTATSRSGIAALRARYLEPTAIEAALDAVAAGIDEEQGGTRFVTPDATFNHFASHWLKRQISLGSRWARVRHNGYRDLVQDTGALAHIHPGIAFERFCRVLRYQYSSGYAPRTWLDGQIRDHDFSDNHVWIPMTARALLMETGDDALFAREVPFNDGSHASVYAHALRALEHLWGERALHGLCKIRRGDWNDCLNNLGPEGRGVSVWLSMAWCVAADAMIDLAEACGHPEDAERIRPRLDEMRARINTAAWTGTHYLRAFNDAGKAFGGFDDRRGRLYLNTQTWAVLGQVANEERLRQAIATAEAHLESELGPLTMLAPYDAMDDEVGAMSQKAPGAGENGGMYLHAAAFKLVADCRLKRHAKVEELIHQLLPFDQSLREKTVCEPYVFCNCTFATPGYRYGTPGQSWGTGTAAWFYTALLNHVYGVQPEWAGLRLDPCLPPSWRECAVTRPFRGATYRIQYRQERPGGRLRQLTVNGRERAGTLLPTCPGATYEVLGILA